jgi:molecular chaperone GrpE
MSQENQQTPDPQHHEGDPSEEMTEEGAPAPESESPTDAIDRELEIFQDLQRLQADFVNYKNRVERDRGAERQFAVAETVKAFLPALDDITRAETHGDITEGSPMAAVAQKLKSAAEKLGVVAFGEKGEKFDPEHHDALVQTPNPQVTEPTVADVVEKGYRLGERMLRPAKVAVFVPSE